MTDSSNSPELLDFMTTYVTDFDAFMAEASTPEELIAAMQKRYPDLVLPFLMAAGAKMWFQK